VYILGINAYHGDAAAALVKDGELVGGRLQTVTRSANERFYDLIDRFYKVTGVPIVLNTSFNENEPIVCTPRDAIDCFLKTRIDVLYLGNCVVRREA